MITSEDIYWLTRMDGIKDLLVGICIFVASVAALSFFVLPFITESFTKFKPVILLWVGCAFVAFIAAMGNVFVPTTKEMAAIKVIPMIANSKDVQGLGAEIIDLAKEWAKELKPKSKAEKE